MAATVPSPGPGTAAPMSRARPMLRQIDYARAFAVLESCDTASSLPDFGERLLAALSREFDLRHVSFFCGATFRHVFGDLAPITEGDTARMLPEYQDRWFRHDAFSAPVAMRQLLSSGVASLAELRTTRSLPPSAEAYDRHFLRATWGMESAAALRVELPGGHTALVGMFDPAPNKLGPAELATFRLLSRQLSAICRGLPVTRSRGVLAGLSGRQRQVAAMVGDGLSNAEIAEALCLAPDSVKKYVSRILALTGCHSRTELALLARTCP